MGDAGNEFLVKFRASVEQRIREQLERHQRINPNVNPRHIVEMQMKQEREYLEKLIEDDQTSPEQAHLLGLLVEWLPQLERKLTGH